MLILTCGGAGVGLALLYMWGDNGKYSGRAGAVTYTKKGVRRNQVNASNPQSDNQVAMRNLLKSFSTSWRGLSYTHQQQWRNTSLSKSNRFGVKHDVSGKNLYTMCNTLLGMIGVAPISAPAVFTGQAAPEIDHATSVIDVSDAKIDIQTINSATPTTGFVLYASLPVAPGRQKARVTSIYFGASAALFDANDAWDAYVAHFGYTPVAGDVISIALQWINSTTGEDGGRGLANRITVQA